MEQRVALVTGGLRGLGRAMALGLGRAGHPVVAVGHIDSDIAELETAAAELQLRDRVCPLVADLGNPRNATASSRRPAPASARSKYSSTMPG